MITCRTHLCWKRPLHAVNNVCILDYLVQNHCSRCDFENKTFHALQPMKFHQMTKFILLSLQSYSVNMVCVMHFCDRSYKMKFLDGQLSSVITVTLQYLHRRLTVSHTRFTEKNKVWAKDVLFIMNFKCAPFTLIRGKRLHLKIDLNNQDEDNIGYWTKRVNEGFERAVYVSLIMINASLLLLVHTVT